MAVAVPLRCDFDAAQLRALAKRSRDPDQTRRLLALAAIYDGASRTEAAQIGCVTLQIVRDWVLRFNARGPEGLLTGRAPGAPPRLTDQQRQALPQLSQLAASEGQNACVFKDGGQKVFTTERGRERGRRAVGR